MTRRQKKAASDRIDRLTKAIGDNNAADFDPEQHLATILEWIGVDDSGDTGEIVPAPRTTPPWRIESSHGESANPF